MTSSSSSSPSRAGSGSRSGSRSGSGSGPGNRIHKEVSYRFHRNETEWNLSFALSMGLFSSNRIDTGTGQLLRHAAEHIDFSKIHRVIDTGCGVGVIGITLKKAFPHLAVTSLDRDALALEVTRENAERNSVDITTHPGLDILTAGEAPVPAGEASPSFGLDILTAGEASLLLPPEQPCDLIITNIPAKAGKPVLRRFFQNGAASLTEKGLLAFVIVAPLRETAETLLKETGFTILTSEHHTAHSVFTAELSQEAKAADRDPDTSFPGPYARHERQLFARGNLSYFLTTVYDIPGFDTIPHDALLTARSWPPVGLPASRQPAGHAPPHIFLFWNPGQGHTAVSVIASEYARNPESPGSVKAPPLTCIVAGRDLLALLITRKNITDHYPETPCRLLHLPGIDYLSDHLQAAAVDTVFIDPDTIPGTSFAQLMDSSLPDILPPCGSILIAGKSSEIGKIISSSQVFSCRWSKKTKGFRVSLLTARPSPLSKPAGNHSLSTAT